MPDDKRRYQNPEQEVREFSDRHCNEEVSMPWRVRNDMPKGDTGNDGTQETIRNRESIQNDN